MNPLHKKLIVQSGLGTAALIVAIFLPAWTLHYWQGWAYVATFILASLPYTIHLVRHDPALLERRMKAGPQEEKEPAQKIIVWFILAAFLTLMVLPPLDWRFGLSPVPSSVSIFGNLLVAFSFYIFYLVARVNSYAAANIRVEEGQKVVDTGVYGWVRHPMYFGALFLIAGTPLALGSWWTLLLLPVFLLILYFRIMSEETVLVRDLPGYTEYRKRVKYRLIPFGW